MGLCSKEKQNLIEEIGLSFEERHNLPPLAGRLFAVLVLSKHDGHSFEELVEISQASKSSVSTNLNLLVQIKYVEYYTKPGDRKRYFRITNNNLRITLEEKLLDLEKEITIVQKINKYNCDHNPQKFKSNESIGIIFQKYLESQIKNLKTTIDKMLAFEKRM